ncbi:AAA family ATPase [Leptolyngbya sp. FACHB-16]|uniref:AAA family ATPase n=1 Tax=unclassified Leptolyngbya TaxID=2650499 RepID=UPI001683ACFE|nr:AAA family ATPase [Leptolyngbya sp. FACHB-16]MBD2157295.1 AAA family ATPase [Leptolyngbya sp. FACHB-16]
MIAITGIAIQDQIYESSSSLVFRGRREGDGQAIVIKLLKQDYPSPQELTRYRQEYEITHSLNLQGVIKAYSQQDYQRTLIILLEDFGGESLEYWMQQCPEIFCPMSLSTFLPFAIDLTDILGKIHAAHIIHKDINPSNIVLNPKTGVIKIIDFGIATQFSRTNPTFKSPHVLEGTFAYLSPEQTGRMNRLLDYRTDFYSLGVSFYKLLTGQLPFLTTDVLELVHCHIAKQPLPPHELNTAIPKAVSDIILKLMAKNAEERYQSAWGIRSDLEVCAQQLETMGRIGQIQLGLQDVSDKFYIPQKLYGREAEIAALLAAFVRVACPEDKRAAEGNDVETRGEDAERDDSAPPGSFIPVSSEMMLVSGYSGVGKSALVQELYKPITARRGYFVSGKFDQFQRNIPYSAIVDALQKLVQQLLGEPEEQMQQWRSHLLTALGSNGQIIIDVIPEVELIIGQQQPVLEVGATEAQNRFNRVFQQFIRVFCSESHPLVIFLDDLQWIDSATLKLIELMLLDEQAQFLFLIGAYRDNEVASTHPLTLMLENLRQQGVVLREINLLPLTLEPVCQLVAETLHQDTDVVCVLAQLVLHKTEGNPFFINEFLKTLYAEDCLSFNLNHRNWEWNIEQIQAKNITDNVIVLIAGRLNKLPKSVKQILQLAACVGNEFDLRTLSIICEMQARELFSNLVIAAQSGLIVLLSELDEQLLIQDYKFSHDRVQQAAYALIDESQKQVVHLQIGRNLLEKTLPERRSERLFEIVDHLNHGFELVTDQTERDEIARLNLMAGRKAKAAIAYGVAKNYLDTGRVWLEVSSWQTNYDLTLALYLETTEAAYLCGEFEQVEHWAAIALQEARTVLDSAKVYEVKIQTDFAQGQLLKVIDTGLQVLQQLGIVFPKMPNSSDIQLELDTISFYLRERSIEDLSDLPEMRELDKLAAMKILSRILGAAYLAVPSLMPLLVSKQVNLSIQYGNSSVSPFAYANFGLVLCGLVGNIESGYQFGQLALKMLSQPNFHSLKARTLNIVNNFIIHWKEHDGELLKPLLEAYQDGLETGDFEFAAYSAYNYCFQSFMIGKELVYVEHEIRTYSEAIRQIRHETALNWIQILQQTVSNLIGSSIDPTRLAGKFYNEESGLARLQAANDGNSIFKVYFNKLFLSYLFSEYAPAVETSTLAESYLSYVTAQPLIPLYSLYDSLARLATYPESNVQIQKEILEKVAVRQEKMKQWAQYAPMNCLHKYHLVEAEKARVLSQLLEAEEFYEQAVQGAKDNEYLQEEALAYELAAKFYLSRGRERFAQTYMKEAHYCYERWGATAKVKDLETRYPQLLPPSSDTPNTPNRTTIKTTSNTSDTAAFDLASVLKASQAISREIELDQLLRSLMQILIENAGARTGCLLLENAGEWAIEAACELNEGEQACATQVLQSIPVANRLPESVIQYVIRTHESVISNDATREGNFIHDPYIQNHKTQSLLCLPLLNQNRLVGVLYLENQLATGAFTAERSQVLNLLSTQAAIAIENAKLYSKLRASENQMAQFLEAIPVAIVVVDTAGRPYYTNQRGIELLGQGMDPSVTPDQIPEAYQLYLAGTDQPYPTEDLPVIRALTGERTTVDDMEICQTNSMVPIEVWGTPVFNEQGHVAYAMVAFQDITERRQAEQLLANYNYTLEQQVAERTAALQESEAVLRDVYDELRLREQQLRLITDALPVCISYIDANRCYQFVNQTYEEWFGCRRDEIVGRYAREIIGEAAYQAVKPYIDRALAGQITIYEAELPYPSGTRYISGSLIPDFDANHQVRGYYGLITDITQQRNAALRELKQAEETTILNERNRMAREIHDTLAQTFTGILVQVGATTQVITDDLEAAQFHLEMIDELARTGLAEARRSVTALRPQLLEEGDLSSALHRLVTQMRASTDTALIYEVQGTAYSLPAEVENNLLRIGQEALTNAIKYAHAREIRVELVYEDTRCILRVKDDGQGFGVGSIPSHGFGLLGMSERAERVGAQLTISSYPGQGTEIFITIQREPAS